MIPKTNTIWYIESNSGPQNWYRVMLVTEVTHNPVRIYYEVIKANGGYTIYDEMQMDTLSSWNIFIPKNVTNDYPEYKL